jgi:hypothetical protein
MINYRKIPGCLLFVTALLFAGSESSAKSGSAVPENKAPGQIESKAVRLAHELQKQGFEVNRGYVKLWKIEDCQYTFDRIGLCLGNNPAAPYIVVAAPPWPDEAGIAQIRTVWGPSPPKYEDVFRFDPREALIILVQMPPPARFFSEESWIFTRQGMYDTSSDTYKNMVALVQAGVLPDFVLPIFFRQVPLSEDIPGRIFVGASLSNPINNVVIERQAETAFGQQRYFIVTPDDYVNAAIRNAFAEIGVENDAIFTEQIPSNTNVGLDLASDDFVTWFRYARPNDGGGPGTASYIWRQNLPIAVLRVRHTDHSPQPYPDFTTDQLEPRTAFDESTFQSDLYSLVSAVSTKWGLPCSEPDCSDVGAEKLIDLQTDPIWMVGPRCMEIGENCLLDQWDAALQLYGRESIDDGEIYAVAGTLGTRTGNATYVGLSINKVSQFVGVANLSDEILQDTANAYSAVVPGNKCPAANHTQTTDCLFLYYFARDCSVVKNITGETNCFEIDEKMVPSGNNDSIAFGLRDYLRPGTQRGPDSSLVLPSIVIRVR